MNSDNKNPIPEDLITVFEQSNGMQTATYFQVIDYYKKLADKFPQISIQQMGMTDSGYPLHMVIFNPQGEQLFTEIHNNKSVLFINNGIHPGESDGIDASMLLFRDLGMGTIATPKNTVVVTIPVYNIGGSLNRNSHTRTNQNGPQQYGFRGNARNYDLNRDFIKSDSTNAKSFAQIFHRVQPDVFIDTHVSNGADYQYVLTHLFTQHNKLGGALGQYLKGDLQVQLEQNLQQKNWDITPYVNVFNQVPETGFQQFMDYPRYSTGYTTLFNTFGMMVETHMLKPYQQRVEGTYALLLTMLAIVDKDSAKIKKLRVNYYQKIYAQDVYPLDWQVDTTRSTTLDFKGYKATTIDSKVTHAQRLKYDRSKPFNQAVNYQDYFKPNKQVTIPKAYIIPRGWHNVIDLLKLNQVKMQRLEQDTRFEVESYRIENFQTKTTPFEGHYQHFDTHLSTTLVQQNFNQGDYLIETNQAAIRYLLETLEPMAPDSFFNWNFFDSILQQRESFSPYVFEELAEQILAQDTQLQHQFKQLKAEDKDFGDDWYAQLDWIHKHSQYYEKAHNQYPIYRLLK